MNTPATIVLNKEALNALFPEGSEARVQLATSAIRAMCTSNVKPTDVGADVMRLIQQARTDAVADVLKANGIQYIWNGKYNFSEDFKRSLRGELSTQLKGFLAQETLASVQEAMANLSTEVTSRMDNLLNAEVNRQVAEKIKVAVAAALNVR